ncbi:MAG TPA: hypothetical protein DCM28_11470 [Phycisphaerales bacterium]|nr:hypothetical protein [Phycisphaerales bacterium]HCD34295.1 hypothetical protein [Phycisphaerales bacterium]|tara:strand:- start:508 stop:1086 length:579 start_codon:yes stop_codon:yes gene_type:complete
MSQLNNPYQIQRTSGICAITERKLEPGEIYIATLVDAPLEEGQKPAKDDPGFVRVDISMQAWDEGKRPEKMFSYWKSTVPEPSKKKKLFVDDSVLFNLLLRLADETQPQRQAFRFVIALILMRKKLLRYDKSSKQDDGTELWTMTPKLDMTKGHMGKWDEKNKLAIIDPHLDEDQIQQVSDQLGQILEAELE